jgi:hypothetical protein
MILLWTVASMLVAASGFTNPCVLQQAFPTSKLARHEVDVFRIGLYLADPRRIIVANESTLAFNEELNALLTGASVLDGRRDAPPPNIMRPPPDPILTSWEGIKDQLISNFNVDPQDFDNLTSETENVAFLLKIYRAMQLSRQFEVACNKEYMMGKVRVCPHMIISNIRSFSRLSHAHFVLLIVRSVASCTCKFFFTLVCSSVRRHTHSFRVSFHDTPFSGIMGKRPSRR